MSKLELTRGAAFLYLESISLMIGGYIFWLVLTKLTTAEIIGTYSTLLSLANIFSIILIMGIPVGVQRFLGKSFSEGNLEISKEYIKASIILVCSAVLVSSIFVFILKELMYDFFKLDNNLIVLLIVVVSSTSVYTLLRSIIISSLRTKTLSLIAVVATLAKFLVAIVLIKFGAVSLGVAAGIAIFPILSWILLGLYVVRMLKSAKVQPHKMLSQCIKNILVASIVTWIPGVINIIGSQLGIVIVNGSQGSGQAGIYFISFSIVLAVTTISTVMSSIAYPALSAMTDGRKRLAWRIIKMNLIVTLPLSCSIMFYSKEILLFFGRSYVEGSSTLEIMMLSIFPTVLTGIVSVLVYSYGNYRQVLIIGLAVTIPRVTLYLILVPDYGGIGAGIAYSAGSIFGLLASVVISKRVEMHLFWKDLALLFMIPAAIAYVADFLVINYLIGVILTFIASYALYIKFNLLDRTDLQDILAMIPAKFRNPTLIKLLTMIASKLNRTF